MAAIADAGWQAVAMDLRGYGASDKPPRGYSTYTALRTRRRSSGRSVRTTRSSSAGPRRRHRVVHAVAARWSGRSGRCRCRTHGSCGERRCVTGGSGTRAGTSSGCGSRSSPSGHQGPRLRRGDPARVGVPVRRLPGPGREQYSNAMALPCGPLRGGALPLVRPVPAAPGRSPVQPADPRAITQPGPPPPEHRGRGACWPTARPVRGLCDGPYSFQLVDGAGHFLTEEALTGSVPRSSTGWTRSTPDFPPSRTSVRGGWRRISISRSAGGAVPVDTGWRAPPRPGGPAEPRPASAHTPSTGRRATANTTPTTSPVGEERAAAVAGSTRAKSEVDLPRDPRRP